MTDDTHDFDEETLAFAEANRELIERVKPGHNVGRWGFTLAKLPFAAFWFVAYTFAAELWDKIPGRTRAAYKALEFGYNTLYETTKAHFIVNVIYGDGTVIPRLARYDSETERVETTNGETWSAPNGVDMTKMWDAPVAYAVAEHHQMTGPVKALIADAVDLSDRRWHTVKQTAEGYVPVAYEDPLTRAEGDPMPRQAVADGGVAHTDAQALGRVIQAIGNGAEAEGEEGMSLSEGATRLRQYFEQTIDGTETIELKPSSTFDDIWLDVSPEHDDTDGSIVSMAKAKELHWSVASTEEMQNQEWRGRQAELDKDRGSRTVKLIIIGVVLAAALILGPMLLMGGDGGAGSAVGNFNPLGSLVGWWF